MPGSAFAAVHSTMTHEHKEHMLIAERRVLVDWVVAKLSWVFQTQKSPGTLLTLLL